MASEINNVNKYKKIGRKNEVLSKGLKQYRNTYN